ncbi:serine/threonine-protein kinase PLK4 [Anopheles nili]|uniref:serine/threonine-protein kinase PLK4 n=1 Tax=Anopheles nili TaxID=185578 RepID=UPI00237AE4DB|nr:serine/threonine-protein kinase PLK4 [Anopheles nili]
MFGVLGNKIENYEVYEILGKGGFGCVYRARCIISGEIVAIKMISKQAMHSSGMTNRVRQEVAIHSKLKHPSILELYTFFEDYDYVYLVLELAENGELQHYLRKRMAPFSEHEASLILRKIVDGLLYLHSHKILHRDISLSNLLLTKDMSIKIADFGLATELDRADDKQYTLCGTPNYISPEVASRVPHGLPADVWGLGCILYTLLAGKSPFDTNEVKSTLERVVMSKFIMPTNLSPDACNLIERLLKKNPSERIKLEEVLGHPFLSRYEHGSNINPSSVSRKKFSGVDSALGTISSGGFPNFLNVQSQLTTENMRYINQTEEQLINRQYAFGQQVREKAHQYKAESGIFGSTKSDAESRISFLDKFNSIELMEKYNITKEYRNGQVTHASTQLQPSTPSTDFYTLRSKSKELAVLNSNATHDILPNRQQFSATQTVSELQNIHMNSEHTKGDASHTKNGSKNQVGKHIQLPSRLDTLRLLPTRHRTKHVILTITSEGSEVVLEFLKTKGRLQEDRVVEVCRISGDGIRFMLYQPAGSRGVPIKDEPPDLPTRGVDAIYNYEDIPEKHWKKYVYAARFVQMVKAKTPKITLYSEKAKCQLMETMKDYEVVFYDGSKMVQSSMDNEMKMFDINGKVYRGKATISTESVIKLEHFQQTYEHCCMIDKMLSTVGHSGTTFPIIIGRRPTTSTTGTPVAKGIFNYRFNSFNVHT